MTRKALVAPALLAGVLLAACGAAGNDVPSGGGSGAGAQNAPTVVAPSTSSGQGSGSTLGSSTPASSPGPR